MGHVGYRKSTKPRVLIKPTIAQAYLPTAETPARPRYELYQISAYRSEPLQYYPSYTTTPAVQCSLLYDGSDNSYKLDVKGRPKQWGNEFYKLGPSEMGRWEARIGMRFSVSMTSGVTIQVELAHNKDMEELIGFLGDGAMDSVVF